MRIAHLLFFAMPPLLMVCAGCSSNQGDTPIQIGLPKTAAAVVDADVSNLIAERLKRDDQIVLRSFDGQWVGTDCDVDFQLLNDNHAKLTIYGNAVVHYDGSYKLKSVASTNAAVIAFTFPKYAMDYPKVGMPEMQIYLDGSDILLVPSKNADGFVRIAAQLEYPRNFDGWNWTFREINKLADADSVE